MTAIHANAAVVVTSVVDAAVQGDGDNDDDDDHTRDEEHEDGNEQ